MGSSDAHIAASNIPISESMPESLDLAERSAMGDLSATNTTSLTPRPLSEGKGDGRGKSSEGGISASRNALFKFKPDSDSPISAADAERRGGSWPPTLELSCVGGGSGGGGRGPCRQEVVRSGWMFCCALVSLGTGGAVLV